jgi:hypothetical protein
LPRFRARAGWIFGGLVDCAFPWFPLQPPCDLVRVWFPPLRRHPHASAASFTPAPCCAIDPTSALSASDSRRRHSLAFSAARGRRSSAVPEGIRSSPAHHGPAVDASSWLCCFSVRPFRHAVGWASSLSGPLTRSWPGD